MWLLMTSTIYLVSAVHFCAQLLFCFLYVANTAAGSFFGSIDAAKSNLTIKLMQVRYSEYKICLYSHRHLHAMQLKSNSSSFRKEE